jgi:hypothetical protein
MAPRCYQSFENGQRCNAPAIHGSKYCLHHDQQTPQAKAKSDSPEAETLTLPSLLDRPSMLAALNIVLQALAEGRIKRSVAETLLSGIKFAHRLMNKIAEAGETILPIASYAQPQPSAIAASSDRPKADIFSLARYSEPGSDLDPDTARMVKEILAQSRDFPRPNQAKA